MEQSHFAQSNYYKIKQNNCIYYSCDIIPRARERQFTRHWKLRGNLAVCDPNEMGWWLTSSEYYKP